MAKIFATPINLGGLELQNARVQNLSSAPGTPGAGRIYYDTTNNAINVYNGTSWVPLGQGLTTGQVQDIAGAMMVGTVVTASYNSTTKQVTFSIGTGVITDSMISSSAAINQDKTVSGTSNKVYTAAEQTKLAGVSNDAVPGTASQRTLGTGAQQAAAGNDARLSDTRTPTAGSVTNSSVASNAAISSDKLADGTTNGVYTIAERNKLSGIATGATANSPDAYLLSRANHTGTESADVITDGTTNKAYTGTEKTKLAGIATGATANSPDSVLENRANHTGTQTASTISDLAATVQAYRLDQFAAPTNPVSFNGQRQTNLADPTNPQDSATKNYVDSVATGLDVKASVAVATTANITLSGLQTIDGYTTVAGDRVLVKNQSTGSQNGIYVAASGAWARAGDSDNSPSGEVTPGLFTFVENGTTQATTGWVLSNTGTITLGTTALNFVQFSGSGTFLNGNGLNLTGNTFSVKPTTGITVTGAGVGIDTTVVVRKYAQAFGDGSTTSFAITHNLGTQDVTVGVYLSASTYDEVFCDVQHTSANVVTLIFASAPATNAYRVVVHG